MSVPLEVGQLAPSRTAPTVELVDTPEAVAELQPEWNPLVRSSLSNSPFLTWEWLAPWWTHLRQSSELRILTVRADGRLIALAPLRTSSAGSPLVSSLEFLGTGHAGSDYLDVILRRGCETEAFEAIARWTDVHGFALRLRHISARSLTWTLLEAFQRRGWTYTASADGFCPFIDLTGRTWNDYLASRGPAHRANFKRRLNTLVRDFDMKLERAADETDRLEALDALVRYHQERFTERGGSTAFQSPALRDFHDDVTRRMLHAGWLRLFSLRLKGVTAAVMYGFAYDKRFYFYQHGFDPAYARQSVGLVLMGLTIKAAIDEGLHDFDMLYGTEPYKAFWADDRRMLARLDLFPPRLGGRIYQTRCDLEAALRSFVRRAREDHAA